MLMIASGETAPEMLTVIKERLENVCFNNKTSVSLPKASEVRLPENKYEDE